MKYEIWSEGYSLTGDYATACMLGIGYGPSFKEACKWFATRNREFAAYFDPERMTHWGCKLFDNHAQASVSFG